MSGLRRVDLDCVDLAAETQGDLLLAVDEALTRLAEVDPRATDLVKLRYSVGLPNLQAGTVIGLYRVLQQLGEGGFGVVYMAEQQEPVRRRVALNIIKLGMDTKQVIARFEAERQHDFAFDATVTAGLSSRQEYIWHSMLQIE